MIFLLLVPEMAAGFLLAPLTAGNLTYKMICCNSLTLVSGYLLPFPAVFGFVTCLLGCPKLGSKCIIGSSSRSRSSFSVLSRLGGKAEKVLFLCYTLVAI